MTFNDCVMIAAVFLGPIAAVQIQKWLESGREKRNQRLWCFTSLMATRAARLSARHIEALNSIDILFQGKTDILESWKVYLDHLSPAAPSEQLDEAALKAHYATWGQKADDLLNDLLFNMAQVLGFKFGRVQLKRGVYAPNAQAEIEADLQQIRRSFALIMKGGNDAIPVRIVNEVATGGPDARPAPAAKGRK